MHGNVLVLTLTGILGMFARGMAFPYASLFILSLGGTPSHIGLINSLSPLVGLLAFPVAGYFADRTGRVKLIGYVGYFSGALFLVYVFAPSWHFLVLGALLRGFTVIQFPASSAIIADSLAPQNRGKGLATMRTMSSMLAVAAPYAAGALLSTLNTEIGMRCLYAFLALAYIASATINQHFLKETSNQSQQTATRLGVAATLRTVYANVPRTVSDLPRSLKALSVVLILSLTANAVAGPFWVVYALEHIGLSPSQWGLILLVEALLRNLAFIPAGVATDRWGRTPFILAPLILSVISTPLFPLASGFLPVLLIRASTGIATAFFSPACSALLADTIPREQRGRVMALLGQGTVMLGASSGGTGGPGLGFLVTIPLVLASLAGGYLYGANPVYPWLCVLVTTASAITVGFLFIRDPKQAKV